MICSTYLQCGSHCEHFILFRTRLGVRIATEQNCHRLSFQSLLKFIAYRHWWLVILFSGYCSLLGDILIYLIISLLFCFLVCSIKSNQRFCFCASLFLSFRKIMTKQRVFRCFLKEMSIGGFNLLNIEMICCSDFESSA